MAAGQGWIEESFACKSVEIINTKTVISRNNTQFEVHQYKRDETTMGEEGNPCNCEDDQIQLAVLNNDNSVASSSVDVFVVP